MGINFYFIHLGLLDTSPYLLGFLRFICVIFPAIFFIKKPDVPWKWLILYGLFISFGQFSFLFGAIAAGMPTGLAAIILQSQAFFTIVIAALMMGERVKTYQITAMVIAALGHFIWPITGHSCWINHILHCGQWCRSIGVG